MEQEVLVKRSYKHLLRLISICGGMEWVALIEHHYINEHRFIKYMDLIENSDNKIQIWRAFQKYVVPSFKFYKTYADKIEWTNKFLVNANEKVISYGIQKDLIKMDCNFKWRDRIRKLSNKFIQKYHEQVCMQYLCDMNLLVIECSFYRRLYCKKTL
jgi:hypothetical protein